jgi:hypothetical protein
VAFLLERKMTRDEIIATIQERTEKLGYVPGLRELSRVNIPKSLITATFGNYQAALHASGLEAIGSGHRIEMKGLFLNWAKVTRELGKIPTMVDYTRLGKHSVRPLKDRYQAWKYVPCAMRDFARKSGLEEEWQDVLKICDAYLERTQEASSTSESTLSKIFPVTVLEAAPVYGEAVHHPAISHAPTNESGVVFLFGVVAQQLGFKVQRVQSAFPDCEAMRLIEPGRWQRVRIEFEYESRNFILHQHPVAGCDIIVCWKNNWPECPLDVVELREVVKPQ